MSSISTENFNRLKVQVAKKSLYAALLITTMKFFAAYFSGSLAVLSEVFHSGIDILACTITILSIKFASKPPDDDHNYGHDKIESFAAITQVLILFLVCSYIIYEAINRLLAEVPPVLNISYWIFGVIIISLFIDVNRTIALRKAAKETKSQALEADALHFSSDILSSIVVLIALSLTYFGVSDKADSIGALVVSGIILFVGAKLLKRAFDSLMDKVPRELREKIKSETMKVKGVESIKELRIRATGAKIFIDMTINISRIIPFSKAHDITDALEKKILEVSPLADIVIHSEPIVTESESINDKIRMIVSDFELQCHDIFSHKIGQDVFTELHIEIDNTNNLSKAHSTVDRIEERIKNEITIIKNVKIHLDEPGDKLFETIDITSRSNEIIKMTKEILEDYDEISSVSDIKVISANGKIRVSMNCSFDDTKTFEEVHDIVTLLESRVFIDVKEYYPRLTNVIIHAEPKIS